jgi:hypothetical protein
VLECQKLEALRNLISEGTSNQTIVKVVPLIVKSKDLFIKPKVSLDDKVYLEAYYHHNHDDIQVNETTKNTGIKSSNSRLDFD